MSSDYHKILEDILLRFPHLKVPVRKAAAALRTGCQTVTLGVVGEFDRLHMNDLFPSSLFVRNGKFILDSSKLRMRMDDFDSWLEAASRLTDLNESGGKNVSKISEELIIEAQYKFPRMTAVDALEQNSVQLKSDITRDGKEIAAGRIFDALRIAGFLKENKELFGTAKIGAEFCKDSKAFRKGTRLRYWTAMMLAAELGMPETDGEKCLALSGIIENATASFVTVFGPFSYFSGNMRSDWIRQLYAGNESAMLSMDNLRNIDSIVLDASASPRIVLCENESPFNQLIRENTAAVYVAGFPNSAVKRFLSLLSGQFEILHWGDTDPEGLAIAAILNNIRPLTLYRCRIEDCERLKYALKELSPAKCKRASRLLESSDFPFKKELEFTMHNGWLEQEAWKPVLEDIGNE